MCIYIYIHTYTHIYIYAYLSLCLPPSLPPSALSLSRSLSLSITPSGPRDVGEIGAVDGRMGIVFAMAADTWMCLRSRVLGWYLQGYIGMYIYTYKEGLGLLGGLGVLGSTV